MDSITVSHLCRQLRTGGIFDVSFTVARGERFAIFGDAGAGKTLLLEMLAGRIPPDSGEIRVFGSSPAEGAQRIGYARQAVPERSRSTPRRLVSVALRSAQIPAVQRRARVAEALHAAGLFERADDPVRELSHTAAVSLSIAAAVACRPDVILVDDLLRLLPPPENCQWREYLEDRRSEGASIVYSTLDSSEAETADRVLVMDRGQVIGCAAPQDLLSGCCGEEIVVEAADIDCVERTLRGISSVEAVTSATGIRFYAADGAATAAHLLRHPIPGMRGVFVRPPSLWTLLDRSRGQHSY